MTDNEEVRIPIQQVLAELQSGSFSSGVKELVKRLEQEEQKKREAYSKFTTEEKMDNQDLTEMKNEALRELININKEILEVDKIYAEAVDQVPDCPSEELKDKLKKLIMYSVFQERLLILSDKYPFTEEEMFEDPKLDQELVKQAKEALLEVERI